MTLPLSPGHYEALDRADERIKALVNGKLSLEKLRLFISEYDGPKIDLLALFPVLNAIQVQFQEFEKKYDFDGSKYLAFIATEEDATAIACYFDFLAFVRRKMYSSQQNALLTCFIDLDPQQYFFAANTEIAIAAMTLNTLGTIQFQRQDDSGLIFNTELVKLLEMYDFIPIYPGGDGYQSDYAQYLDENREGPAPSAITLGEFHLESNEVQKLTTLELIKKGMVTVTRESWPELISLARKAILSREFNLQERQQMVSLHVLQLLNYERVMKDLGPAVPYTVGQYVDILSASLLSRFPELTPYAVAVLTRYRGNYFRESCVYTRLASEELLVFAINTNKPDLIEAVVTFCAGKVSTKAKLKLITPVAAFTIIESLGRLNREHVHLPLQIAVIKVLIQAIKEKDFAFVPAGEVIGTIQSFIMMLQLQLNYKTEKDIELSKGLLLVISLLLDSDPSSSLTLSNDSITLKVLADAALIEPFQSSAVSCFSAILNADMLCYAAVSNAGLWPTFMNVVDDFAFVKLFECLNSTDTGKELISEFEMSDKLVKNLLSYGFRDPYFSQEYYSSATVAVVSHPDTLLKIGNQVPNYLVDVLAKLDSSDDQTAYDQHSTSWKRRSGNCNLVDHCMLLLSSLSHRDQVRKVLQLPETFDLFMRIVTHPHLPYDFPQKLASKDQFRNIMNELFLIENAEYLMCDLLKRLATVLRTDSLDINALRKLQAYATAIQTLGLKKGDSFLQQFIPMMFSNENFQALANFLPDSIRKLAGAQYDILHGPSKHLMECFPFAMGHAPNIMAQMQTVQSFEMEMVSALEEAHQAMYIQLRSHMILHMDAFSRLKDFMKFYSELILSAVQSRILFPEGFSPGALAIGTIQVLKTMKLSTTRGRFILEACSFVLRLDRDVSIPYFVYNGGPQELMDLWISLHSNSEPHEMVRYNHFSKTDYIQLCKHYLESCFVMLSYSIRDWGAISAVDPSISEETFVDKMMEFRTYIIKTISETNVPITASLAKVFWQVDIDISHHLNQRMVMLESIRQSFENLDINSIRYCIQLHASVLQSFEHGNPILNELVPRLFATLELSSLALLCGIYRDPYLRYNVPVITMRHINSVFDTIFQEGQSPAVLMCACELLLSSPIDLLARKTAESSWIVDLMTVIKACEEPWAIRGMVKLVSLGISFTTQPFDGPGTLLHDITEHCFAVFTRLNFDADSILALGSLLSLYQAFTECDYAVLEMGMKYLIGTNCPASGIDTNLLEGSISRYANRSIKACNGALNRYFFTDQNRQIIFPRRTVAKACNIPLVLDDSLPELGHGVKGLIDNLFEAVIAQAPGFVRTTEKLIKSYQDSDNFYIFGSPLKIRSNTDARRIDSEVVSSWNSFREVYFRIKIPGTIMAYLTLIHGSPAEYISNHARFDSLINAGLMISNSLAIMAASGNHQHSSHLVRQYDASFQFIRNLLEGNTNIMKRTISSMKQLVESASETEAKKLALGILYARPSDAQEYQEEFFLELQNSNILHTCGNILGLHGINNGNREDNSDLYIQYYRNLNAVWTSYSEGYNSNSASKSIEASGPDSTAGISEDARAESLEATSSAEEEEQEEVYSSSNDDIVVVDTNDADSIAEIRGLSLDSMAPSEDDNSFVESELEYNSDEEEYDEEEYYDSEYDSEDDTAPRVGGDFDIDNFCEEAPREFIYLSGLFQIRNATENKNTRTLQDSYRYSEDDGLQSFYDDPETGSCDYFNEAFINLAPCYIPEEKGYNVPRRIHVLRPSIARYTAYGFSTVVSLSKAHHCKVILNDWKLFGNNHDIDWSIVPILSSKKLVTSSYSSENTKPKIESPGTSEPNPSERENNYSLAVSNALGLLENPDELKSWGLDMTYLDGLPEQVGLEALISYLSLNAGEEMTPADIKATLDDSLFFESSLLGLQKEEYKTTEYASVGITAQFPKNEFSELLQEHALYFDDPAKVVLSADVQYDLGITLTGSFYYTKSHIPGFHGVKEVQVQLLNTFRDKLLSRSPELQKRPLEAMSVFAKEFSHCKAGNLPSTPFIDFLGHEQLIRNEDAMNTILSCLKESVEEGPVEELTADNISNILSVYLSGLFSKKNRKFLKSILPTMIDRGFIAQAALQQSLSSRIIAKLDDCITSIYSGELLDDEFSGLETMLSSLTSCPICDLSEGSEGIVAKAIVLSSQVSEIIASGADISSSIRLLRCYLFLITLTPKARPAFITFVKGNKNFVNRVIAQDKSLLKNCILNLNGNFDLLDLSVKTELVRTHIPQSSDNTMKFTVHRNNIFLDSYKKLKVTTAEDFSKNLFNIKFDGEPGFDGGGLTREWLTLLAQDLSDTRFGLFSKISGIGNGFVVHPNPESLFDSSNSDLYEFVGKMMAKAILLKQPFDANFTSVIYSTIVSKTPANLSLLDLHTFDDDLATNLEWILENDITDVLMETFVAKSNAFGVTQSTELKPGGKAIPVTEENKKEYVQLIVKHTMFSGVEQQIMSICSGFWSLIPYKLVKMLTPLELELLLCGGDLDVDEWKKNTFYQGYTPNSLAVKNFWLAIKSMSDGERRKVLLFATGTDKVSALGFGSSNDTSKFKIAHLQENGSSKMQLPTASTCISQLFIPNYKTHEEALLSLRKAIEFGGIGFGFA